MQYFGSRYALVSGPGFFSYITEGDLSVLQKPEKIRHTTFVPFAGLSGLFIRTFLLKPAFRIEIEMTTDNFLGATKTTGSGPCEIGLAVPSVPVKQKKILRDIRDAHCGSRGRCY